MLQAILLSGIAPKTMAERHVNASLGKAYAAHWVALIVGAACLLGLLDMYRQIGLTGIPPELDPTELTGALLVGGIILAVEVGFLLLAFILLPWANARVPAKTVWRHTLRTVWLHTGHLAIATLAYTAIQVGSEVAFAKSHYGELPTPERVHSALADIGSWFPYLLPLFFAAALIWYLWALLRAVILIEPGTRAVFPPRCEICGYDLSHHDTSARCPECGTMVADSLSDGKRGPVAWRFSHEGPTRTTFHAASVAAWTKPDVFFSRVSACTGLKEAGQFLFVHMVLCAAAFFAGFFLPMIVLFPEEIDDITGDPMPLYGFAWAAIAVGLLVGFIVSFIASVIGLIASQRERRNCFGFTLRVACYLSAIFPLWVFSEMTAMIVVVRIIEETRLYLYYPSLPVVMAMGFLGCSITLIALFATGITRRLPHIRYANS